MSNDRLTIDQHAFHALLIQIPFLEIKMVIQF